MENDLSDSIVWGVSGVIISITAFLGLVWHVVRRMLREARRLEAERRTRQNLEKLNTAKDQFITLTQHHLRTPVSTVNWMLESVLAGEYGAVTGHLKRVLEDMSDSGKRLMRIVDDFLNITAIRDGTSILHFEYRRIEPLIDDIFSELKPLLETARVSMQWPRDEVHWPALPVDTHKLREALLIIFENAVRYNVPGGSIAVTTRTHENKDSPGTFEIKIVNTGMGITPADLERIGTSLFYRSEAARRAYPDGMGVGLSLVKTIIRAHQGAFTIESAGPGKGARATILLPLRRTDLSQTSSVHSA